MESCLFWCIPKRLLGKQSAFRDRPGEAGVLALLRCQGCWERQACGIGLRNSFRSGLHAVGEGRVTWVGSV